MFIRPIKLHSYHGIILSSSIVDNLVSEQKREFKSMDLNEISHKGAILQTEGLDFILGRDFNRLELGPKNCQK